MKRRTQFTCLILKPMTVSLAVVLFNAALCQAAAGPGGDTVPYAWVHAGDNESEEYVTFAEESFTWQWGPLAPILAECYALGDITTDESALAKASCQLYYHDPFEGNYLTQGADVETCKPFMVTSDTIPNGQEVPVSLNIEYMGTLEAFENKPGKFCTAFASGELSLLDETGNVIQWRSGDAEVMCEADAAGNLTYSTETWDYWDGWLSQIASEPHNIYELAYTEQINFDAEVGGTYWLYFDLATNVYSSEGFVGGSWPTEGIFAQSDFSNTGTYNLSSTSDVSFQMLPEPLSLILLAIGSLALFERR